MCNKYYYIYGWMDGGINITPILQGAHYLEKPGKCLEFKKKFQTWKIPGI